MNTYSPSYALGELLGAIRMLKAMRFDDGVLRRVSPAIIEHQIDKIDSLAERIRTQGDEDARAARKQLADFWEKVTPPNAPCATTPDGS